MTHCSEAPLYLVLGNRSHLISFHSVAFKEISNIVSVLKLLVWDQHGCLKPSVVFSSADVFLREVFMYKVSSVLVGCAAPTAP